MKAHVRNFDSAYLSVGNNPSCRPLILYLDWSAIITTAMLTTFAVTASIFVSINFVG